MPPKKDGGPSKKTEQKKKDKIIEVCRIITSLNLPAISDHFQKIQDKTFGLKNKNKSTKVQKYVQQVSKQVNQGTVADRKAAAEKASPLKLLNFFLNQHFRKTHAK